VLFFEFLGTAFVVSAYTLSRFDTLTRSIAYFIGFILLFHVTGAHFNPATTLADYLHQKSQGKYTSECDKKSAFKMMLYVIFTQMMGSLFGVLITFLLAKFYI
jgi:glycerol uptake facilitator-like aquaporin